MAVLLLSPTIASVHEAVEDLELRRDMPWSIWKWDTEVDDAPSPSACGRKPIPTESEITDWPERIAKDHPYELGGHVIVPSEGGRGAPGVTVDVFMNETKELPGDLLGTTVTDENGRFELNGTFPFELRANRYHLVAHAHQSQSGCNRYEEHWSDPEMDVVSETNLTLEGPDKVVIGEPFNVTGTLLDSVGAPVSNRPITLNAGGQEATLTTDENGRFWWNDTASVPGDVTIRAQHEGDGYYSAATADHALSVVGEAVQIPEADDAPLQVQRSTPRELAGRILLTAGTPVGEPDVVFHGIKVVTCEGCEPTDTVPLEPEADGSFSVAFTVPASAQTGDYTFDVRGGGLEETHSFDLALRAPVYIEMDAGGAGLFEERYEGSARLYDDRDQPVSNGSLALMGPGGYEALSLGPDGVTTFSQASPCGQQVARVIFNGTEEHVPAQAERNVVVCPMQTLASPFGLPWWAWLLGALAVVGGAWYARSWWRARAPVLNAGPPLALEFAAPDDEAPEIAGVGEQVALVARLDEPLPEGHSLRIGTIGDVERVTPDPETLSASRTVVPEHIGKLAVRGEIVDGKGRVVTRRTVFVRVVRYAEEIEQRWRALKQAGLGEASEAVSPREFEQWLANNAQDLDPEVARRLVAIFEEADYGPRDVSRRELLGFLRAEKRLQGVSRPAAR